MAISMATTQNFFVRAMSSSGAQKGLSDQAIPMLAVPTVISRVGPAQILEHRPRDPDDHRERDALGQVGRRHPRNRARAGYGHPVN